MMAYIKPARPVIVIAANKLAEFEPQRPNKAIIERSKKVAEMLQKNNQKGFKR